jgi:hypothetical protein
VVTVALLASVVGVLHSRGGVSGLSPSSSASGAVAAAIAAAQAQATAGDPRAAAEGLLARAANAADVERTTLRDEAAGILAAAATASATSDPVAALDLLRGSAALSDVSRGVAAAQLLPDYLVAAARALIDRGATTPQAADLLREANGLAPQSTAAAAAQHLLAAPVAVRGRLSIAGKPAAGLTVALFPLAPDRPPDDPQPADSTPVAQAKTSSEGTFDLGNLTPGAYLFGYTETSGRQRRPAGAAAVVSIAPAQLNVVAVGVAS